MSIALAGAHRTGKSTLAADFSVATGAPHVQVSATPVFERLGLSPKEDYPLDTRVRIQNAILDEFEQAYAKQNGFFVTDRSPIDLAAYLLADVQRTSCLGQPDLGVAVQEYLSRCFEVTNRHFAMVFVVQPAIPIVEEEGKGPGEVAYMEHLNALVLGLCASQHYQGTHFYLPRYVIDRSARVRSLVQSWARLQTHSRERAVALLENGVLYH